MRQSERLGEYLSQRDQAIDAVYCGPAKRHRQTLEALASAPSLSLPVANYMEGLAELPAFRLLAKHGNNDESSFKEVIHSWMHGNLDCGDLETSATFCARVDDSLQTIRREQGRGKTILVVTSGGPTMAVARRALTLSDAKSFELLWVIANSSVSEFRFRDDDLSLIGFNRIAHLDPEHITYR